MDRLRVDWVDAAFAEIYIGVGDNFVDIVVVLPCEKGRIKAASHSFTLALSEIFKKANFTEEAKMELSRRAEEEFNDLERFFEILGRGKECGLCFRKALVIVREPYAEDPDDYLPLCRKHYSMFRSLTKCPECGALLNPPMIVWKSVRWDGARPIGGGFACASCHRIFYREKDLGGERWTT